MPKGAASLPPTIFGAKFGRPDIERIGLFSEMPYMHGARYPWSKPQYLKGVNMMAEGPKIKAGKTDCYFDKEFKRIFTGEAIKGRGRKTKPDKRKPISTSPFIPVGGSKQHSTPGDYYGTFEKVTHFSPLLRKTRPAQHELRNFITNPGKKGSYGYANTCINPYPSHSVYRYGLKPKYKKYGTILNGPMITRHYPKPYFDNNPFPDPPNVKPGKVYIKPKVKHTPPLQEASMIPTGPGKLLGGCKCGGFEKFPEYKPNKYFTVWDLNKPKKHLGTNWFPQSTAPKTLYTFSIIQENVRFRLNERTLGKLEPTFTKYLRA